MVVRICTLKLPSDNLSAKHCMRGSMVVEIEKAAFPVSNVDVAELSSHKKIDRCFKKCQSAWMHSWRGTKKMPCDCYRRYNNQLTLQRAAV